MEAVNYNNGSRGLSMQDFLQMHRQTYPIRVATTFIAIYKDQKSFRA